MCSQPDFGRAEPLADPIASLETGGGGEPKLAAGRDVAPAPERLPLLSAIATRSPRRALDGPQSLIDGSASSLAARELQRCLVEAGHEAELRHGWHGSGTSPSWVHLFDDSGPWLGPWLEGFRRLRVVRWVGPEVVDRICESRRVFGSPLRLSKRWIVPSRAVADRLVGIGVPTQRILAVEPFLSERWFSNRPTPRRRGPLRVEVLAGASASSAIRILAAAQIEASLDIWGDRPDRGRIERIATAHRMRGRIRFRGRLGAAPESRRADVVLHLAAGREAGWQLAAAMASGVAVLAARATPGSDLIRSGQGGIRLADAAPCEFADALRAISVAERRTTLQRGARACAERHWRGTRRIRAFVEGLRRVQ